MVQRAIGLKDSTKNNGFKRQNKEQYVYRTVQRTMGLKNGTKNNGFKGQYKEQWV